MNVQEKESGEVQLYCISAMENYVTIKDNYFEKYLVRNIWKIAFGFNWKKGDGDRSLSILPQL